MLEKQVPTKKVFRFVSVSAGIILGLALGIGGGFLIFHSNIQPVVAQTSIRQDYYQDDGYTFINPLMVVNQPQTTDFKVLRATITTHISSHIATGDAESISFFFKDLSDSRWFGTDTDEVYSPGSLAKVLTMIAYFRYAEDHPEILSQKLYYDSVVDENTVEHIRSPIFITRGSYTVEDLIERMIKNSDNNAATLLNQYLNNLDYRILNQPLLDLGIKSVNPTDDYMTIKNYALFFRVLYNATYLSRSMSEKALQILSETDFNKGLMAGVSPSTRVSHKFGEFTIEDSSGDLLKRELHDCGIVYDPSHPYLLCVMTKGTDFQKLENVISDLSQIVYQSTDRTTNEKVF